jgi:protein-disulfide isomerase
LLRRTFILGGVAALVAAGAMMGRLMPDTAEATTGWNPEIGAFDKVMGSPEAPVTLIEYASFTCSHCADFHTETLPVLKERFIDPGMVRLVFRDFPLDGVALRAGMLARCAGDEAYFDFIDAVFASQRQWIGAADPVAELTGMARMMGMSPEAIEECLADQELADRILALRVAAHERYGVEATPTFVVNGEVVSGNLPTDSFVALIERHVATD